MHGKLRRTLGRFPLVAAVALAVGVGATGAYAAGATSLSEPQIVKSVSGNSEEGYRLNLTVKGEEKRAQSADAVDVVLVMDNSWSMRRDSSGEPTINGGQGGKPGTNSRAAFAKAAADNLIDKLLKNNSGLDDSEKTKVSVVNFSDNATIEQALDGEGNGAKAAVASGLDYLYANTATNWEGAFEQAESALTGTGSRDDAKKCIIFISDGDPTVSKNNTGANASKETAYNAALAAANRRAEGTSLFVLSAADDESLGKMEQFAGSANGKHYNGTTSGKLNDSLREIANAITSTTSHGNIAVEDTLSKYVDFASLNGDTLTDAKVTVSKAGEKSWEIEDPNIKVEGDKVTWKYDKTLEDGWTYTLSFGVVPNQDAYDYSAENATNTTNGAVPVPTNAENGAKLTYHVIESSVRTDDGTKVETKSSKEQNKIYAEKPTIDIPYATITVTKKWSDKDAGHADVTVNLSGSKAGDESGNASKESVTLGQNNNWTADVYVPAGIGSTTWKAIEQEVPGYDSKSSDPVTVDESHLTGALTVENTKQVEDATLTVRKVVEGSDKSGSFSVSTVVNGGRAQLARLEDGQSKDYTVEFSDPNGSYAYTVQEVLDEAQAGKYDVTVSDGTSTGTGAAFTGSIKPGQHVTVTVTNKLKEAPAPEPTENGTFEFDPGRKYLTGDATLKKDDFTFDLYEGDSVAGQPLQSKGLDSVDKDGKSGSFAFDAIELDHEGTYGYTIVERNEGKKGYSYDARVYHLTFEVTVENGKYVAGKPTLTVEGGELEDEGLVFRNGYEKPVVPAPDTEKPAQPGTTDKSSSPKGEAELPQTGDSSLPVSALAGIAAVGAAAVAGGVTLARKRR